MGNKVFLFEACKTYLESYLLNKLNLLVILSVWKIHLILEFILSTINIVNNILSDLFLYTLVSTFSVLRIFVCLSKSVSFSLGVHIGLIFVNNLSCCFFSSRILPFRNDLSMFLPGARRHYRTRFP